MSRMAKATATGAGIGFGIGLGLGGLTAGFESLNIQYTPEEAREILVDAEFDVNTSAANLENISIQVGKKCLSLVSRYGAGGNLYGTSEETVVSDLLAEPGQPCGASQSDVRQNARNFIEASTSLSIDESRIERWQNTLESAIEDEENRIGLNDVLSAAAIYGLIGAVVGAAKQRVLPKKEIKSAIL